MALRMKRLQVASKSGKGRGHYHIVYLNDETGTHYISEAANHIHEIQFQAGTPAQPAQTDPQSGQEIQPAIPATDPVWAILPGEDGHMHDLEDYRIVQPKTKEDEAQTLGDCLALYAESIEIEQDSLDKAEKAEQIYQGNHWDDSEKRRLNAEGRAALTLNKTQKHVNELSGVQRQERRDIAYAPTEAGDQRLADLYSILAKVTLNNCNYGFQEAEMFLDTIIGGRGGLNLRAEYDESLSPQIIIERYAKERFHFGPHEELDASDAEYLIKEQWVSRAKLERDWPDRADDITEDFDYYSSSRETVVPASGAERYLNADGHSSQIVQGKTMVDVAKKSYRVLEVQRKIYTKIPIIVNQAEGFVINLFGWKEADIRAVKSLDQSFYVIKKPSTRIRITKIAGSLVLSDQNPANLPFNEFSLVPVYATKRGPNFFGVVEAAKDPQLFMNKLFSLVIDIGNKNATYGWGYDAETFASPEEETNFRNNANSPGFTTKLTNVDRPPHKFEGTRFPSEIVQIMEIADSFLAQMLNISVESGGANESYSKLMHLQKMRLTGNEFLFDHLSLSKKRLGRLLPAVFKRYLQPADVWRIVVSQNARDPVMLGGQQLDEFTQDDVMLLYQDGDPTKLDVEVVEAAFSPTVRMATFMMLMEMQKNGMPVPPDLLLQAADIPDTIKKKWETAMEQQAEAQAQAAKSTENMEIRKTLIAKNIIPPGVLEEQGIQQPQFQGAGSAPQEQLAE
jgi:hypothetical protein